MSRQNKNQSTHDHRVRTLANELRNEGGKFRLIYRISINQIQLVKTIESLTSLQLGAIKQKSSKWKLPLPLIPIKSSIPRSDVVLPERKWRV